MSGADRKNRRRRGAARGAAALARGGARISTALGRFARGVAARLPQARALAWALLLGGLGAAWTLGVPRLQAYAASRVPTGQVRVSLAGLPAWVEPDLRQELVQAAARHIGPDPFRRDDLVSARHALMDTGWFRDVQQVRRLDARSIEVQARFAVPAAVVRDAAGREHLVDSAGRLLPRSYPAEQPSGLLAITGAASGPPASPGLGWPGQDVPAALALLRLMWDRPWLAQVARIDVSRHDRDGSIRIITDRGCTIDWGRAPGAEGGAEVPASQKLGYLDYHHAQYGHIDRGLQELDVTGDVVVGR